MTGSTVEKARQLLADVPGGEGITRMARLQDVLEQHESVTLHVCGDEHTGARFGNAQCRRGRAKKIGSSTFKYHVWAVWK